MNNRQSINLHRTLEKKKQLQELMKINPEEATKQLMELKWKSSHRPQGISTANATKARKHRKDFCERCGATTGLLAHHKNGIQSDNSEANIQTLCFRCHRQVHISQGDWYQ